MTAEERRALWVKNIENYRGSGLTAAKWCEDHQIRPTTLKWWIMRFNKERRFKESSQPKWVALAPHPDGTVQAAHPLTVTIGTCRIEVFPGFDAHTFHEVVQILTQRC
jgi:hypothetical protein